MFKLLTKKEHKKILKHFKPMAKKLSYKTWQTFFHNFETTLGENVARPRYSPKVMDYYDFRDFIPGVRSK